MENNVLKISKKSDRLTVTFVHRSLKKTIKSTVAHSDQTNELLENQTELAQNNENHSKGNAVSGQAVNSSSTRLIASRAELGPRSTLCSNFTTKLLSLLMLSGTAEASSGPPKKEEEEAHTLGELIRDYHQDDESWVGTTGRFLQESGIRAGLDNTFETLGDCAEVVTKALFGMPERGLKCTKNFQLWACS